jgi:peptide-methionine (R)-S-oxide reductase
VNSRRDFIATAGFLGATALGFGLFGSRFASAGASVANPMNLSDAEWRKKLTRAQYNILRQEGTEAPFTSPLNNEHRKGVFACAGCATKAFRSETKFDSGTGWPSFYEPIPHAVSQREDSSLGMVRTEVHCATCGGHLGHVFDDGPRPTGLRYCMNGAALTFQPA